MTGENIIPEIGREEKGFNSEEERCAPVTHPLCPFLPKSILTNQEELNEFLLDTEEAGFEWDL